MSNSTHSSSGARAAADPITAASSPYYVANDKTRSDIAKAEMMAGLSKLTAVIYKT